jgi:hypothetical protein
MSLNYEAQFGRGGLLKTITVKEHTYDLVEFTVKSKLTDELTGEIIIDSGHTSFFSTKEFKDFFGPIVNDLKVRIENESSNG